MLVILRKANIRCKALTSLLTINLSLIAKEDTPCKANNTLYPYLSKFTLTISNYTTQNLGRLKGYHLWINFFFVSTHSPIVGVKLPAAADEFPAGTPSEVSGWGVTNAGSTADVLQAVSVNIDSDAGNTGVKITSLNYGLRFTNLYCHSFHFSWKVTNRKSGYQIFHFG